MGATCGEQDVLDRVGSIYDAALNADLWPDVLARVADALNSPTAVFIVEDLDSGDVGFMVEHGVDPESLDLYSAHYAAVDVRLQEMVRLPPGKVISTEMLVSDHAFERHEFHADFLSRYDLFYASGTILQKNASEVSFITAHRPKRAGPYSESELDCYRLLVPHLQRAVQLHRRYATLEMQRDTAADALDHLSMGTILVTQAGHTIAMNRAAKTIVAQNDGLVSLAGSLAAATRAETEALCGLIARAAQTGAGRGLHSGGALALSRPSMLRPLYVVVAPLGRRASVNGFDIGRERATAVVFVNDPERWREAPPIWLARLYNLTPAEARLAANFAETTSLKVSAEALGITEGTARQYLKQIFQKTDTKSQAELMKLLLRQGATIYGRQ